MSEYNGDAISDNEWYEYEELETKDYDEKEYERRNDSEKLEIEEALISAIKLISLSYNYLYENKFSTDIPRYIKTENFSLHYYCECDRDNCNLCNEPEFTYKPFNLQVSWYKHLGRGFKFETEKTLTANDIIDMIDQCSKEIKTKLKMEEEK